MLRRLFVLAVVMVWAWPAAAQQARFQARTASVGLGSTLSIPGDGHGPAGVFTDLNNDGYADLLLPGAGIGQPNLLMVNVPDGSGGRTFEQAPANAGVNDLGAFNGAIAADYDNDGDADLYLINWNSADDPTRSFDPNEKNRLFRNDLAQTGVLGFTDVTDATDPTPHLASDDQRGVGFQSRHALPLNNSLTAAWADVDRDGNLDLYVGTHNFHFHQDVPTRGQRDTFYRNNGDGTFTDQTEQYGLEGFETRFGNHATPNQTFSSTNAVQFADFNNDQWPDLLVTNKVGGPDDRNMLYINRGADDQGNWLGYDNVAYDLPTTNFGTLSPAAMGVDVADIDNDGDLDFYITDSSDGANNFAAPGLNDLWINQLSETGELNFTHSTELPGKFSWGTRLVDVDNNGFVDAIATTVPGVRDILYLNSEDGFTDDVAAESGFFLTLRARGVMSADYNRDGLTDLMIIYPNETGRNVLYENTSDTVGAGHFLSIHLEGDPDLPGRFKSSRDAIGARVIVTADLNGDGVIQDHEVMIREVTSGSGNAASTSSLDLAFGLGLAETADVRILWPSGRETQLSGIAANGFMTVIETLTGQVLVGDLNGDGFVGAGDLDILLGQWNESAAPGSLADLNTDGFIGAGDLDILLGAWNSGEPLPASAGVIPEPGTLAVLALGAMGAAGRRRR